MPSSPASATPDRPSKASVGWLAGASLVVGNMVGVGVFTSLGFQLDGTPSGFAVLLLWTIGGAYALCGALAYAELSTALPRSGGEYHLIGSVYHPAAGFLAGWVSVTVGFAAPVAAAASLFGIYLNGSLGLGGNQLVPAIAVLAAVTAAHLWKVSFGGGFQIAVTSLKFLLVVGLAIAGFANAGKGDLSLMPVEGDFSLVWGAPFAISLFFVNYSYAGWNAATYVAGEIRDPARGVPRALVLGTLLVMLLYLIVNAAFIVSTPAEVMAGKPEVGLAVAKHLFGEAGGSVVGALIAFGLISLISAMTWAGPRVGQMMGQDYRALGWLARENRHGVPIVAVLLQSSVALVLLLVAADVKQLILYLEFVLNLSLAAAVGGVFWLRWKRPDLPRPYRALGYPITPLLFLVMAVYIEWRFVQMHPKEAVGGLLTLALGALLYAICRWVEKPR